MRKILATILKEWTLTRRDVAGIMLLFLMPSILIIVMAMIQDAPFKDYQELKFDLLVADHDNGKLARVITMGLKEGKSFNVIDSVDGAPLTEERLKALLEDGTYKVGIVIPQGATAEMVNAANIVANNISKKIGLGTLPSREVRDGKHIRMYFDPVSKPTFRMSVTFALDKYITLSSSSMLVDRLDKMGSSAGDSSTLPKQDFEQLFKGIGIKETSLSEEVKHSKYMNSVQHNVPAWAIFGMFFIVIPICSHLIREREEGSALRILLIPNARRSVALGKICFYTIICTLQFVAMFCVGLWVLPMLDLPSLYLGVNAFLLIPMAVSIAFAATSYGYFIGTVFKTSNQAMPFGAISVVILSALGGIWVPIDVLSPLLQGVAKVSPLFWALDGINNITLRNGSFNDVAVNIGVLLAFSTVLWVISTWKNKNRYHSM